MKKIGIWVLIAAMILSVSACGNPGNSEGEQTMADGPALEEALDNAEGNSDMDPESVLESEAESTIESAAEESAAEETKESMDSTKADSADTAETTAETSAEALPVVDIAALEAFNNAMIQNASMESVDMQIYVDVAAGDENMVMDMHTIRIPSEEDGQFAATGTLTVSGTAVDVATYYTDGYMYMESMGVKMKSPSSYAETVESMNLPNSFADEINEDGFVRLSMTEQSDGSKVMEGLVKIQNEEEVVDGTISICIDADGYMVEQSYELEGYGIQDEVQVDLRISMSIKVNAYNDAVEITFPDFSDFKE